MRTPIPVTTQTPAGQAPWQRFYVPKYVSALAVIVGWVGVYFAFHRHWLGIAFPAVTTALTIVALRRGNQLARRRRESLRGALDTAAARNRQLERLGAMASVLLHGTDLSAVFRSVAEAALDLTQAEGSVLSLVVEEGRFLKLVAAAGVTSLVQGHLLPADNSLPGWVINHDEPLICDDTDADPRTARLPGIDVRLQTAAIVPLRSAGVAIGAISVHNRRDGRPFSGHDLQLLRTLADQAVVGLDRARTFDEIQRNERALTAKNAELERATKLKSDFLANMSHELRTPLNAIIGFSDLILSGSIGALNDQQQDFLGSVLRNGQQLLTLINDVLDLSKIEAGRMTLSLSATDVRGAITAAITDTASLRAAKQQRCELRMDDESINVIADAGRVRQVLFNLLSNASKFTPEEGEITLSAVQTRAPLPVPAERAGEEPRLVNRDAVWISISDTGIGIKEEDVSKLFREFSQVDSSASRQQQGTGLGLALCKQFVQLHGGTIGAESIYGRGSTFWFLLPIEGPTRKPQVTPAD